MIKTVKYFPFLFEKNNNVFYIIKIKHKHAKWPPSATTPQTLTLGLFMDNDHDIENIILNIKKHWKLKCEKYTGFKAQMEK